MTKHQTALFLYFVDSGHLDLTISKILPFAADARQHADYDAFTVFDEAAADLIVDVERFVEAVAILLTP